ncbi:glutamine synthetase [Zhenpiania hominis]|uniref:glutamine synthetase n=1 Tax=Zhenpiania hominis TaxID=2763644 RepID=A0A923NMG9_9FIRM|nr:glutamine synthetase [Zhenpiania hominis]MBC6680661.1 glutamine synthetase [Zhenpiania hominis]
MLDFDLDKMLFTIPAEHHSKEEIRDILKKHPEVRFVSLVGIDIGGHDTDEKIPAGLFLEDIDKFLSVGVQTDGSSVVLPKIAELNNAKVDIIPDTEVNWYVDHNFKHIDRETGLPVGTLRIPSFLIHNDVAEVGARVILRDAIVNFKRDLLEIIKKNPYVLEHLPIDSVDDIEKIEITAATELEFWVKTPDDETDREQLSTAQILKEQYWKRTIGPVRTALEETMLLLDRYGLQMEMGHKEVGGVKAKLGNSGNYDHVMEQLEIDWKFSTAIQAADNENHIKYIVRDIFRLYGLDVTFMAKPMEGVAGSGEHTHMGLAAKLKDGRHVNLFAAKDMREDFLSPIGFGALMGILKNYDVVNPFVSATNDAFNRLKPGYEAPVCVVTSLGHGVELPSRNRTVLVGLVRDVENPLATRFELRAPNPKSNTYLVLAASYMAMLDGIKAALEARKTSKELEASISKDFEQEDFYLERDRLYRSELDVFEEYTSQERDVLFGRAPRTVWENICAFDDHAEKLEIFQRDNVMTPITLASYKEAIVGQWATELHNRIVPNTMDLVRNCVKCHDDSDCVDYDVVYWEKINEIRNFLGKDRLNEQCLLTRIVRALDSKDYDTASRLQVEMQGKVKELTDLYIIYKKNLF